MIARYFVEFVFFSFLGWVWESIYCTIKNKGWSKRGFLFGPICPIYGFSVVIADLVFAAMKSHVHTDLPLWVIFLICMVGSAIMEYVTSWYLEERFHATWWDYSELPLNIQGRICPIVSIGFGLAGVVIVKYVLPLTASVQADLNTDLAELLSIILAAVIGADLALTEASLSSLLKSIEQYKAEFDQRAEETYTNMASMPQRLSGSMAKVKENVELRGEKMRELASSHIERMTPSQKYQLSKIKKFNTHSVKKKIAGLSSTEYLKNALQKIETIRKN